jgi:hypothetical protein
MTTLCEPELQTPNLELRTPNPEQELTLNPRILRLFFRSSKTHR